MRSSSKNCAAKDVEPNALADAGCVVAVAWGKISMDWDDYLREQAAMYRHLAEKAEDALVKQELLDLAATCEETANNIEDRLTGG